VNARSDTTSFYICYNFPRAAYTFCYLSRRF